MEKKPAPSALDSFLQGHLLGADRAPIFFKTRGGGGGGVGGVCVQRTGLTAPPPPQVCPEIL